MITGFAVPLEAVAMLCAAFGVAGIWAGRRFAIRQPAMRPNPLADLLRPGALGDAIDLAARRNATREGSRAVLRARIDQLGPWRDAGTPDELHAQVAAVMRAGLRRNDQFTDTIGEGFTIIIPDADERTATRIADRLRRALRQAMAPSPGGSTRLTASFGVAAERNSVSDHVLGLRARRALDAAMARGEDHVVAASDIEEVILLPAPEAPTAVSAA